MLAWLQPAVAFPALGLDVREPQSNDLAIQAEQNWIY